MKKALKNTLAVIGIIFLFNSCTKNLDLAPISNISDANFWKTPGHFDAFVTGLHDRFRSHQGNFIFLGEMRADIFGTDPGVNSTFTGEATEGRERLWLNNLDADEPGVGNYGGFYSNINQLNLLINKINSTDIVTPANKNYYLGIAHGMRAFYYFQLYRSWGKVIIVTEPTAAIDISNLAKAASTVEEVMTLIKADIEVSLDSYGTDYSFRLTKSFWPKAATLMLKADVFLWTSYRGGGATDAGTAKAALTEIQSRIPTLTLLPNFANVFAANNKGHNEIIFAIRNVLLENALPIAGIFLPQTSLIPNFWDSIGNRKFDALTDNWGGTLRAPVKISTYRRFSDLDSRKFATIQAAYNKVGANYLIAGAFIKKYQGEQNAGSRFYSNDFPIYRYADLLLMLAEAKVILGENPGTEINLVRARAYGANYNAATIGYPNQAIDADPKRAILEERYLEFIFEGKRWYDLRRFGESFVFANTIMPTYASFRLLWPLDRNTLINNRSLQQNPGYPLF